MTYFNPIIDQIENAIALNKEKYKPSAKKLLETKNLVSNNLSIQEEQLYIGGQAAKEKLIEDNNRYLKKNLEIFTGIIGQPNVHRGQRGNDLKFKFAVFGMVSRIISEFLNNPPQQREKPKQELNLTDLSKKDNKLKSIWLAEPKLSVKDFLQKGNAKGFWNDSLKLTIQKSSSTYGSGKSFLGNIFIAFKGCAIPQHIDYKEAGKVFCEVFDVKIKESTKEPYKAFSSGNVKQINELKRTFGVK